MFLTKKISFRLGKEGAGRMGLYDGLLEEEVMDVIEDSEELDSLIVRFMKVKGKNEALAKQLKEIISEKQGNLDMKVLGRKLSQDEIDKCLKEGGYI
jgi:riboflavin biosynthesis pyrimidine reductase